MRRHPARAVMPPSRRRELMPIGADLRRRRLIRWFIFPPCAEGRTRTRRSSLRALSVSGRSRAGTLSPEPAGINKKTPAAGRLSEEGVGVRRACAAAADRSRPVAPRLRHHGRVPPLSVWPSPKARLRITPCRRCPCRCEAVSRNARCISSRTPPATITRQKARRRSANRAIFQLLWERFGAPARRRGSPSSAAPRSSRRRQRQNPNRRAPPAARRDRLGRSPRRVITTLSASTTTRVQRDRTNRRNPTAAVSPERLFLRPDQSNATASGIPNTARSRPTPATGLAGAAGRRTGAAGRRSRRRGDPWLRWLVYAMVTRTVAEPVRTAPNALIVETIRHAQRFIEWCVPGGHREAAAAAPGSSIA